MLILTRRIGEKVIIDNNIHVTVLGVNGNQVRIGFEAPKEVAIHREEIQQRITKGENPLQKLTCWGKEVNLYIKPRSHAYKAMTH